MSKPLKFPALHGSLDLICNTLREWFAAAKIADVPRWIVWLALAAALGIAASA